MAESIFSEPFYVEIPPMRVAKDRVISTNPEDEVIARLEQWALNHGVDIARSRRFGFDVPVSKEEQAQGIRGYEYWLQVPVDFVIPVKTPSHPEPVEGHAVLNKEWMPDQVEHDVRVEPFPGGKYIALRITEPFAAPFERIPQGWQTLVKYIKENNLKVDWCTPGSCLEEVKTIDGVCYGDVLTLIM